MGSPSGVLALLGGNPVRRVPWPKWPRAESSTEAAVLAVLRSERWTISGPACKTPAFEHKFAVEFAKYHGVPYCVPTANGSAALTISLEALGIGPGKEVLVPGLTWVACASAVARVGAIPILVDIDPRTLSMSAAEARQAISPRTAAIMLVHLYCRCAALEEFTALATTFDLPLIEDCSHMHGAIWRGRRVGTFGTVGVFSMQQTKVLTSGEGGAVITSDPALYDRLQQLRADGRRYTECHAEGGAGLEPVGDIQGHNYCLSEFQAAVLLDRLPALTTENERRLQNALCLTERLLCLEGVRPLHEVEANFQPTFYRYCIFFDRQAWSGIPIELTAAALSAELGVLSQPIYDPLNKNPLFDLRRSPRTPSNKDFASAYDPLRFSLPAASAARRECLGLPHHVLLGSRDDVDDIAIAVEKLLDYRDALRQIALTKGGVTNHGTRSGSA